MKQDCRTPFCARGMAGWRWRWVIRWMFAGLIAVAGFTMETRAEEKLRPVPFFAFDNGVGRGTWSPERQASTLAELGYDGIGYSGVDDFAERAAAFDRRGLKIFNLYVGAVVGPDGPTFDPKLPAAIEALRGREMALWLTVNGKATDADAQAASVVTTIADLAAKAGVRVVLYPHAGFHIARVEDAVRVARLAGRPNVGVTFNLCHFLKVDDANHLKACLQEAMPLLEFVSINGADAGETNEMDWDRLIQPLGSGSFDVRSVVTLLDELGYAGPIGLQCYNVAGDPVDNLRRSLATWRKWHE